MTFPKFLVSIKLRGQGRNVLYFLNQFVDCKTVHPIAVKSPLGTTTSKVFKEKRPTWQGQAVEKLENSNVV